MTSSKKLDDISVTILIAEDDPEMLEMLKRVLEGEGYKIQGVGDGETAMRQIEKGRFDIVLTDLKMPGASGMDVLKASRARHLHQPVILMTAFGTIDSAVQAIKEGAHSYITKPFDIDELTTLLAEISGQIRLQKFAEVNASTEAGETAFPIVFRSALFRNVIQLVREVAPSTATVLISGESGTGKELIAREIHRHSNRSSRPFVAVDLNAVPESLFESELFGHLRGSFTGADRDRAGIVEQANGGTLFLDEIGNLSLAAQSKLLRFLQERKFRRVGDRAERESDVRLITATNKKLESDMQEGNFRDDLFYRLSVIHLKIPPLRERKNDIAPLAYHFLRKYNREFRVEGFESEVIDRMMEFHWPGNVRQLENAVEHSVIIRKAGLIRNRDLPDWLRSVEKEKSSSLPSLGDVEKEHILSVLEGCQGNRTKAASILGINRRTLARKLISYGLVSAEDDGED